MNRNAYECPADQARSICQDRHWALFWILILCSVVTVAGRVAIVQNHNARGDSAFFSANDRSRWCTIRALGDNNTYEIDDVIARGQAIDWDSIDKVQHLGRDNQLHYYSSKPALFPTLLAWKYRAIKYLTGANLADNSPFIVRLMLLLVNVIPWALFLWLFAKLIDQVRVRDWTRYFVLACAAFGTFLGTFAVSLNNHLPAAFSVMFALYGLHKIWGTDTALVDGAFQTRYQPASWAAFFFTGLFAAFAAANELPALSFLGCALTLAAFRSIPKTLIGFVPGALIVVAGFFLTNYNAHGEWKPPYAHRGDGAIIKTVEGDFAPQLLRGELPDEIRDASPELSAMKAPKVSNGAWAGQKNKARWVVRDLASPAQIAITGKEGSTDMLDHFEIRQWNNWYDYEGSYWRSDNEGRSVVDQGQPDQTLYAFHVLFGHHGIFSLTPIWLLSFAGMIVLLFNGRYHLRWLGLMGIVLSVVVVGFYLNRPPIDRNYGGVTSGLRWVFWLAPIWLVAILPVADWLGTSKSGRWCCFILLGISALSALYSAGNPWVHPWLYEIWEYTGIAK